MSRYNIETAKSAGFCFGVKRAVEIAERASDKDTANSFITGGTGGERDGY